MAVSMPAGSSERLSKIPSHLRIWILHEDEDVVVINKPCNLRSVPGHANPPVMSSTMTKKRPRGGKEEGSATIAASSSSILSPPLTRRTGQEAWVSAIQSFQDDDKQEKISDDDNVASCLQRLATADNKFLDSIPRKFKLFQRYMERNRKRFFQGDGNNLEELALAMFQRIQERQRPLMNLPEPTIHEDSALGQLILMGYGSANDIQSVDLTSSKRLLVVHRLDCETSGVMVFARNEHSASFLSKAWRERDQVSKIYLAKVREWPPLLVVDDTTIEKQDHGTIDLPLEPSEERLKWQVVKEGGKPSKTLWKVLKTVGDDDCVILELQPVTGRTHQLRIHCAHIGSGIVGDSLYGMDRVEMTTSSSGNHLHLHAHKLAFPHPTTKQVCEFSTDPSWH